MHQDLWSERFEGNGAPTGPLSTTASVRRPGDFPTLPVPAVGRSFTTSRATATKSATSRRRLRRPPGCRASRRVGFDPINEPACELKVTPCDIPPDPEAAMDPALYDDLIPALRKADPTPPSFYEEGVTVTSAIRCSSAARRCPRGSTAARVSPPRLLLPVFRNAPCSQQEPDAFNEARAAAKRNGAVPLLTEFGATDDLSSCAAGHRPGRQVRRGLAVLAVQDLRRPDHPVLQRGRGPGRGVAVDAAGKVKTAKVRRWRGLPAAHLRQRRQVDLPTPAPGASG